MATILITWELGGGLGHVSPLQPVVDALAQRGCGVVVAMRQVSHATMVFQHPSVRIVQAPYLAQRVTLPFKLQCNFAHILHNVGFDDVRELRARTIAWETLYEMVNPDVIVCDHSPTALLASWQREVARLTIGTGFTCPPSCQWLPNWRPTVEPDLERLHRHEAGVTHNVNQLLRDWKRPPLAFLTELYARVDETVLTTFAELDHYQHPRDGEYWGTLPGMPGVPPCWPEAEGKRIFGYLKPNSHLPEILKGLIRLGLPTIVFVPGIPSESCPGFSTNLMRVVSEPLDMQRVAQECDVAITHGGHGTTVDMLLAGKPLLVLPQQLEQRLTAQNLQRIGAGIGVSPQQPKNALQGLRRVLHDPKFTAAAQQFAARHRGFDAAVTRERLVGRIAELATRTGS